MLMKSNMTSDLRSKIILSNKNTYFDIEKHLFILQIKRNHEF